jgi:peptidoglycan/xylan/chitin deacetylase (PgdA/CDA1 family)
MKRTIQRTLLGALTIPGIRQVLSPLRRGAGTVFMLHRITDPTTGAVGTDPADLRRTLGFLRKRGYPLVSVDELFASLKGANASSDYGVAFTLDDGYAEQVRVAGPIFAEFDCPATVFLTTGFLDRTLWQWWDRIEYAFETSRRNQVSTTLAGATLEYRWETAGDRDAARDDFTARCKQVQNDEKLAAIDRLAAATEVELPSQAPERYAPMAWSEVRTWETRGLTFGPHTVTHPILSRTGDAQSREEICGSWDRLRAMAGRPTPIFCYPNGQPEDLGDREFNVIREIGLVGALTTTMGHASASAYRARPENPFLVRRFPYPNDHRVAALFASGAERLRQALG